LKLEAIRRVAKAEHSLSHIARDLDIHPSLLQHWRRKFNSVGTEEDPTLGSPLEEEVRRLRREVAALREDREILKNVAAFFAKEFR